MPHFENTTNVDFPDDQIVVGLSPKMGNNPLTESILLQSISQLVSVLSRSDEQQTYEEIAAECDPSDIEGAREFMRTNGLPEDSLLVLAVLVMGCYVEWRYSEIEASMISLLADDNKG